MAETDNGGTWFRWAIPVVFGMAGTVAGGVAVTVGIRGDVKELRALVSTAQAAADEAKAGVTALRGGQGIVMAPETRARIESLERGMDQCCPRARASTATAEAQ